MAKAGNCEVGKIASQSDTLWLAKSKADAALSDNRTGAIDRLKLHREIGAIEDRLEHICDSASFMQARSAAGAAFQAAALSDFVETLAQSLTRKQIDKLQRFAMSAYGFAVGSGGVKASPSVAAMLRVPAGSDLGQGPLIEGKANKPRAVRAGRRQARSPLKLVSSRSQVRAAS